MLDIMATKESTTNFAVIATGGKQYVVSPGDVLDVELIEGAEEGKKITFDQVLMQNETVGTPVVSGAKVTATVVAPEYKGKKLSIIRFKAKSNRFRKIGHRQKHTRVKIETV
jgi:large subunit ribosomal protein L21